jgi:hypothetical protein
MLRAGAGYCLCYLSQQRCITRVPAQYTLLHIHEQQCGVCFIVFHFVVFNDESVNFR